MGRVAGSHAGVYRHCAPFKAMRVGACSAFVCTAMRMMASPLVDGDHGHDWGESPSDSGEWIIAILVAKEQPCL